jgi:two-component system, chemotaxis family, chemotaxis protein CheY
MAKILICDDSDFMRMILKRMLVENGHEVVGEAINGKQAVELYQLHSPELTTMDITMPEMDGISAVKVIHELNPLAKIIMVTAIGQRPIITEAIKAGAADFVVKPFDNGQVLRTITTVLKQ